MSANAGTPSIDDAEMVGEPTRQRRRGFSMNLRRTEFYIFLAFGILILGAIGIVKIPNPFGHGSSASATPPPIAGSSTLGEAVLARTESSIVPIVGSQSRLPLRGQAGGPNGGGTQAGGAGADTSATPAPDPLLAKVMEQEAAANRQPATSGTVIMPPPAAATVALQPPPLIVPNPREAVAQGPQGAPPTFPPDATTPAPQVYTAVVSGGIAHRAVAQPPSDPAVPAGGAVGGSHTPTEDINARRQAFASSSGAPPGYLNSTERAAMSEVEVFAGTPLCWHLDDTINTDLPGTAQSHLTCDVHSSLSPYPIVFPRGTTVTIRYFPSVLNGESRVEVVSDVMTLPDGRTFDLQGMPNSDVDGSSGNAASSRDDHRGRLFTTTFLTAILAAGLQLSQPASSLLAAPTVGQQIAGAAGSSVAQTGQQLIQSQVSKPPTLIVERGRQYITRLRSTIVVEPYKP